MLQHIKTLAHHTKRHLKDHLVPHQGNNYHPHALRHRVLFGYSLILILLKVIAVVGPIALPSSSLYSSVVTPVNIVDLTNQTRKNLGLPALRQSNLLAEAAAAKARDMLANQYFAHTSPSGLTPWNWFAQVGYRYLYAGENLAVHYDSAEGVTEGWIASPSHRANIVNRDYTEIGVGVVSGEFENAPSTFVVELFGRPVVAAEQTTPLAVATRQKNSSPLAVASKTERDGTVAAAESSSAISTPLPFPSAPNVSEQASESPLIRGSSLVIKDTGGTYRVRITVDNAVTVTAQVAGQQVVFGQEGGGQEKGTVWQADVPYNTAVFSTSGEPLVLTASNEKSIPITAAVAVLAPHVPVQKLYVFNEGTDKITRFFGFLTIHNLDDGVRRFYLYFMVALGASLLFNMFFVQLRLRHPSVLGHTLAVIVLASILTVV